MIVNDWRPMGVARLFVLTVAITSGCSSSDAWKEAVQLHDGSTMTVERRQVFAGFREFGQRPPIREEQVTFVLPRSEEPITWKSGFSEDIGHADFSLLALDVVEGTPYVVAYPTGCLAYNKWGRPNPPYVISKYAGSQWSRIPLSELPSEITRPNVLIDTYGHADVEAKVRSGSISANDVLRLNSSHKQDELRVILRMPTKHVGVDCGPMVLVEGTIAQWVSPGGAKAPMPTVAPVPIEEKE